MIDKKTQCYINTTNLLKYYLTTDEDGKQRYKKCAEGYLTCVSETRNDCTSCVNEEKYYQNYTDKDKDKDKFMSHMQMMIHQMEEIHNKMKLHLIMYILK